MPPLGDEDIDVIDCVDAWMFLIWAMIDLITHPFYTNYIG